MIKHIVMFKLANAADAWAAKEMADKLPGLVPSIRKMEVVINSDKAPDSN